MKDIDVFEEIERTQLHSATQDGNLELMTALIKRGCPVNAFDMLGKTPLHYAAMKENLDAIKVLLAAGADVNAHDKDVIGNTPLGEVAGNCSFEVARTLIEAGADPSIPGWMQLTALYKASQRKRPEGQKVYQLLKGASERTVRLRRKDKRKK